ncbi:MAG TPA: Lrp/AsnC ligand binding domain-containing protein [Candidatus Nanoarchaeia archaeon]|nr:Lrp/AsnC ligand binding domain-containing protein [Candidatus Nanoarchaeia archaeon]
MQEAYLFLNVEVGREMDILKTLKKSHDVDEAYILFGEYDIIAKVKCSDKQELNVCINRLKAIDGIGQIKSFEVADVVV